MAGPTTDAELVSRCRSGDQAAWNELVVDACLGAPVGTVLPLAGKDFRVVGTTQGEVMNLVADSGNSVNVSSINCGSGAQSAPYFVFGLRG